MLIGLEESVSVPLSGLLFLNYEKINKPTYMLCFRPLIGVIISKHLEIDSNGEVLGMFPSPYRGYYF